MPHARGKIRRATATTASFGILLLISLVPFALIGPVADAQIYLWTTIAGSAGYGSSDGTNSVARFHLPTGSLQTLKATFTWPTTSTTRFAS